MTVVTLVQPDTAGEDEDQSMMHCMLECNASLHRLVYMSRFATVVWQQHGVSVACWT